MSDSVSVKLRPSRALCGTTPDEFGDLLTRLAPLVEAARDKRLDRPDRQRARGAGAQPTAFRIRLLVALTHLRLGISLRETASIFDIDEKSVRNWRNELESLLVQHGVVVADRAEPVRTLADLAEWLKDRPDDDYLIIDGTNIARPRPGGGWPAQRAAWSTKSRNHAVKGTLVCDSAGNPVWFEANPSGEGRTHDIAMLRSGTLIGVLALSAIAILGDQGYQGLDEEVAGDVYVPTRRRPGKKLNRDESLYNHGLAQARIRVEHGIRRVKRWGAMRQHRRHPDTLDRLGQATVVLDSLTR